MSAVFAERSWYRVASAVWIAFILASCTARAADLRCPSGAMVQSNATTDGSAARRAYDAALRSEAVITATSCRDLPWAGDPMGGGGAAANVSVSSDQILVISGAGCNTMRNAMVRLQCGDNSSVFLIAWDMRGGMVAVEPRSDDTRYMLRNVTVAVTDSTIAADVGPAVGVSLRVIRNGTATAMAATAIDGLRLLAADSIIGVTGSDAANVLSALLSGGTPEGGTSLAIFITGFVVELWNVTAAASVVTPLTVAVVAAGIGSIVCAPAAAVVPNIQSINIVVRGSAMRQLGGTAAVTIAVTDPAPGPLAATAAAVVGVAVAVGLPRAIIDVGTSVLLLHDASVALQQSAAATSTSSVAVCGISSSTRNPGNTSIVNSAMLTSSSVINASSSSASSSSVAVCGVSAAAVRTLADAPKLTAAVSSSSMYTVNSIVRAVALATSSSSLVSSAVAVCGVSLSSATDRDISTAVPEAGMDVRNSDLDISDSAVDALAVSSSAPSSSSSVAVCGVSLSVANGASTTVNNSNFYISSSTINASSQSSVTSGPFLVSTLAVSGISTSTNGYWGTLVLHCTLYTSDSTLKLMSVAASSRTQYVYSSTSVALCGVSTSSSGNGFVYNNLWQPLRLVVNNSVMYSNRSAVNATSASTSEYSPSVTLSSSSIAVCGVSSSNALRVAASATAVIDSTSLFTIGSNVVASSTAVASMSSNQADSASSTAVCGVSSSSGILQTATTLRNITTVTSDSTVSAWSMAHTSSFHATNAGALSSSSGAVCGLSSSGGDQVSSAVSHSAMYMTNSNVSATTSSLATASTLREVSWSSVGVCGAASSSDASTVPFSARGLLVYSSRSAAAGESRALWAPNAQSKAAVAVCGLAAVRISASVAAGDVSNVAVVGDRSTASARAVAPNGASVVATVGAAFHPAGAASDVLPFVSAVTTTAARDSLVGAVSCAGRPGETQVTSCATNQSNVSAVPLPPQVIPPELGHRCVIVLGSPRWRQPAPVAHTPTESRSGSRSVIRRFTESATATTTLSIFWAHPDRSIPLPSPSSSPTSTRNAPRAISGERASSAPPHTRSATRTPLTEVVGFTTKATDAHMVIGPSVERAASSAARVSAMIAATVSPSTATTQASVGAVFMASACVALGGGQPFQEPSDLAMLPWRGAVSWLCDSTNADLHAAALTAARCIATIAVVVVAAIASVLVAFRHRSTAAGDDTKWLGMLTTMVASLHMLCASYFGSALIGAAVQLARLDHRGSSKLDDACAASMISVGTVVAFAVAANVAAVIIVCWGWGRNAHGTATAVRALGCVVWRAYYGGSRDGSRWIVWVFTFEDVLVAYVLSAAANTYPTTAAGCIGVSTAMLLVSMGHLVYVVLLRPYCDVAEQRLATVNAALTVAIAIACEVGVISTPTPSDRTLEMLGWLRLASNAYFVVQLFLLCGLSFVRWLNAPTAATWSTTSDQPHQPLLASIPLLTSRDDQAGRQQQQQRQSNSDPNPDVECVAIVTTNPLHRC